MLPRYPCPRSPTIRHAEMKARTGCVAGPTKASPKNMFPVVSPGHRQNRLQAQRGSVPVKRMVAASTWPSSKLFAALVWTRFLVVAPPARAFFLHAMEHWRAYGCMPSDARWPSCVGSALGAAARTSGVFAEISRGFEIQRVLAESVFVMLSFAWMYFCTRKNACSGHAKTASPNDVVNPQIVACDSWCHVLVCGTVTDCAATMRIGHTFLGWGCWCVGFGLGQDARHAGPR